MEENSQSSAVDWEVVAYHEAGHGVVATVLGFETESLKLVDPRVPADKLATKADFHGPEPRSADEARQSMCNRAVYLMAGRLAETLGTGRSCPDAWPADDVQIDWWYDIISSTAPAQCPPRGEFDADARARAEALLAQHWPAIRAVAQELLISREIDGQRLRDAVTRSSREI